MDTRLPGNSPKDDLLVSWKDIAAYLKCSVRKAQRLERLNLPVHRISGTKSVWALGSEIDGWLKSQSEKAKGSHTRLPDSRESSVPEVPPSSVTQPTESQGGVIGRAALLGLLLVVTAAATLTSAYGLTIVFFVVTAIFMVVMSRGLPENTYTRAVVGLFMIAGMAYAASATTLPGMTGSVINMMTLRPAFAYPFVTGLRFIPIPALISILLVVLTFRREMNFSRTSRLRKGYVFCGVLSLSVTAIAGLTTSGALHIWQAGLPIRWTLLAGESFIVSVNLALFVLGYRFFSTTSPMRYHQVLSWCGTGYLLIALTAAIVDRHWNEIDKYYLDIRRPDVYRVQNANAENDLRQWLQRHAREVGPDFVSLSNDPEFLHALRAQEFYKQDFDEPLQVWSKAVIFGYRSAQGSRNKQPPFVLIRFPADLVAALRFESVEALH